MSASASAAASPSSQSHHHQREQDQQDQDQSGLSLPLIAATPLLTTFTSFLTIAIHSLLYHRNLYPPTSFLTARAFNLPVHQSRHPGVCAWVNDAVSAISNQLHLGAVQRIVFVVHGSPPQRKVCERWVFDVERFPAWGTRGEGPVLSAAESAEAAPTSHQQQPQEEDELMAEEVEDAIASEVADRLNWADIHEALRGALQRLAYAAQGAGKLPSGCTFTLALELREEAEAPIGHPQPWIPSESHLQPPTKQKPYQGESRGGVATRPIRSVRADPLFFECWLEQGSPDPEVVNSNTSGVVTNTSSESIPQ
ncbi:horma domain-containing [Trichoderma arundinaceum]|uniref:Horma domain-containing n=1 Tax=Trichoderma arundinaceum TaxID=490622 RepID=A0A395NIK2_TRIAR|nr:horma domain-containing [Trichoderma arundinaceum]